MQNPFLNSGMIALLLLALLWLATVRWTFADATARFRSGWAWLVISAVLPFLGWGFYLLYRASSLTEYDDMERGERIAVSRELKRWTWRKDREAVQAFVAHAVELTDKERSRLRERAITFRRRYSLTEIWRGFVQGFRANMQRTAMRLKPKPRVRPAHVPSEPVAPVERQADETVVATTTDEAGKDAPTAEPKYGKRRGRERKKQKYEEMLEFLAETPQEDSYLEELIYNGKYALALEIARDNLAIAREMSDHRKVVTYEKYVVRLKELT